MELNENFSAVLCVRKIWYYLLYSSIEVTSDNFPPQITRDDKLQRSKSYCGKSGGDNNRNTLLSLSSD